MMIRTIITPEQRNISIQLPKAFVGKRIEVIAFAIDETDDSQHTPTERTQTHLAAENVLAKDWLSPEEELAWQNL